MSIVLISPHTPDLWKFEHIRERVREQFPNMHVEIVCGEFDTKQYTKPDVSYIYKGLQEYFAKYRNASKEDIIQLQKQQAHIIPANNYKSDQMYFYGTAKERDLVLVQTYVVDQMMRLLTELKPQLVFMTDGATINRTATVAVCEHLGIRYYRMYPEAFLNFRGGWRYFFCPNNLRRLSDDPRDEFDYSPDITEAYAAEYLNSVQRDTYQLDKTARSMGQDRQKSNPAKAARPHQKRDAENYALNASLMSDPSSLPKPYFLFPLNTPSDTQILIRAPHFKDCLSICEQIGNVLPYGHSLVIKEHPVHPGMLDHYRLKAVLKAYDNIFYIGGTDVRLRSLLSNATALITINSTAAIEALLSNVPVVTLGESFYRESGLAYDVSYLLYLQEILTKSMAYDRDPDTTYQLLHALICRFLQQTVPGPDKMASEENFVDILTQGVISKLQKFL